MLKNHGIYLLEIENKNRTRSVMYSSDLITSGSHIWLNNNTSDLINIVKCTVLK